MIREWLNIFVEGFFNLLMLAILARALISWFRVDPYHPIVQFLEGITDPIMRPLRKVVPPLGTIDITPIVALILLQIVQYILIRIIIAF